MAVVNPPRYHEKRWKLLIGRYTGIEQVAIDELQRVIQAYVPYVLEVRHGTEEPPQSTGSWIVAGTLASNQLVARALAQANLPAPPAPQGYTLACVPSPWSEGDRLLLAAGSDEEGLLYAAHELGRRCAAHSQSVSWKRVMDRRENLSSLSGAQSDPGGPLPVRLFEDLPIFTLCDFPRLTRRGIWTWGYVVYDYRRFLDAMARLKLNWWVVWNDIPPINASKVIDYAHQRGVQVVFGYPWGWGFSGLDLSNPEDRRLITADAVARYRQSLASLDLDGIYFQTLTEHHQTRLGGESVAALACRLVNETAAELLAEEPGLPIYFGLHATSIQEYYRDLSALDSRVTIVWEDAGGIPYLYEPGLPPEHTPDAALDYSLKLAALRPETPFALVPKGWSNLDWAGEFEHHGPYILGERAPAFIASRLEEKQPLWDRRNALWNRYYPFAARFYREMVAACPAGVMAAGLVEDGMLEARIQPSVALFAEMLWNPDRPDEEILSSALAVFSPPLSGSHQPDRGGVGGAIR